MSDERMRAFAEAWNNAPRRVEYKGVVSYYDKGVLVEQRPAAQGFVSTVVEVKPMDLPDLSFLFPESKLDEPTPAQ